MLTAFIVDDEFQCREFLSVLLKQYFPEIQLVGQAATVDQALEGLRHYKPDIVFLDIQLNAQTGFDLLNRLPEIDFALIFTTAFDQYAIKAFRFNAIDYLLKPVLTEEFKKAVQKVISRQASGTDILRLRVDQLLNDLKNPAAVQDKIAIPTQDGFLIVPVHEIIYCRASSNYTDFILTGNRYLLSSYTLKQYDEMLSPQSFFRAHRSYLINLTHVKMYKRGDGGEIVMSNGDEVELSRTHKDVFLRLLNIKS